MTKDEQVDAAEVMLKHAQGFRVEGTTRRRECWRLVDSKPNWDWVRFKFRVAELPPSINWNDVHPDYIYLFIDNVGISRMCTKRPLIQNSAYITSGRTVDPRAFSSFREGNCLSIDSLVERIRGTS